MYRGWEGSGSIFFRSWLITTCRYSTFIPIVGPPDSLQNPGVGMDTFGFVTQVMQNFRLFRSEAHILANDRNVGDCLNRRRFRRMRALRSLTRGEGHASQIGAYPWRAVSGILKGFVT